ncbi:MAG TPA: 2-dehydro-3-deoxy-D-gluconate 5-dehydrogenase KduD [Opitutales bacterium]|jgi:2-deoxy-D-gluconate 3-dehydrogenase|nr:2-dehydro-3-deoxy-D-gluconate 5-dehydrogenase KduD [Opitutales bacterium]
MSNSRKILDTFRLDGKVAIVTGASRGLGAAMACAFAEAGAKVALAARGEMKEVVSAIRAHGGECEAFNTDLADRTAPKKLVEAVEKRFGGADILVNNAGIIRRANFLEYSDEDWDAVMDVNIRAAFVLSREFAKRLAVRKAPGRIINIASMLSFQGGIRVPAYTAAKSAIAGLTKAMANELAPLGICVNAIAPGYMATDNTTALRADPVRNKSILERIPAGRWGEPTDLNGAAVFLASDAAAYVHGITLPVDGGWLAR